MNKIIIKQNEAAFIKRQPRFLFAPVKRPTDTLDTWLIRNVPGDNSELLHYKYPGYLS